MAQVCLRTESGHPPLLHSLVTGSRKILKFMTPWRDTVTSDHGHFQLQVYIGMVRIIALNSGVLHISREHGESQGLCPVKERIYGDIHPTIVDNLRGSADAQYPSMDTPLRAHTTAEEPLFCSNLISQMVDQKHGMTTSRSQSE